MKIIKSDLQAIAALPTQYPIDDLPEIAFAGRSNVGKSSFINSMINRVNLARTSSKPGKTRTVNFYIINDSFRLVDLPGYGYAKVSKEEKKTWGKTIETYLTDREQLKKIILLVDSRRKPTNDDILMCNWIKYYGYDLSIAATKSDKLKRSEIKNNEKIIRDTLDLSKEIKVIFHSTLNKSGREELLEDIFKTYNND